MATPTALRLGAQKKRFSTADVALAALVMAVVGLMIVPLPTWVLDLLIASNLAASVAILLVTLYVSDALRIAAFPTLLLLTTLVRLALNVSSTRLILLQADAGEVIRAFGTFVVRGNYVVGGVIFLILSIIQFVVIAKGSERVAEVGARFTLDAMPGKQMAIDAELRSGAIDGNEARRRRRALSRESQFYGAMDGAMKFVKGDVIASFLITLINLLGGIAIGVGMKDLELVTAVKRYGLLTIGDGLVTQIPALVLATAAGILVTRVASEEPDTPLGQELATQIFGAPRALRVASVFVLILAAIPGLPALPFLVIGALLFFASRSGTRRAPIGEASANEPVQRGEDAEAPPRFVPVVVPWSLDVSPDLAPLCDDDTRGGELRRAGVRAAASAVQEVLFRDLGVPLPAGRVAVSDELPERTVVLCLGEVPAKSMVLSPGLPDSDVAAHLVEESLSVLRRRAADFLGISETQVLLDQLEQVSPATVRQVVPKPVPVVLLADVLRRLVEEGVSVRDLRGVLESLAQVAHAEKDSLNLAEYVRSCLRRPLSHQLTGGSGELEVLLLDSMIEDTIRGAISRTAAGSFLTLAPAAARDVVRAVRRARDAAEGATSVVLTQPDVRRFVKKLIELDMPELRVVSYAELLPEIAIRPAGKATLAGL
ncbi:MAG: FHIPEP family type III secretion protein [Polyangiaceae bacterium]|nr:FHIPEP family type III secretion protein [Polyangiaceae bacterium]MCL4748522.1 FHIPEP family type III secretion protein [Myxococcales bacterium]